MFPRALAETMKESQLCIFKAKGSVFVTSDMPVVKLIFDLCIDGKGPEQIARILEEKQILTAKALYAKRKKKPMPERPYHWGNQSIVGILERQERCV